MGRQQWQNGSAVALAEGLIEKRIRIGTKSNCKSEYEYEYEYKFYNSCRRAKRGC
jgi:hypothetical protein